MQPKALGDNQMNKKLKDEMESRYELISKLEKEIERKMKTFPEGRLVIKKRKSSPGFYIVGLGSEDRYLNKADAKLIAKLAQKDYFKKVLINSNKELEALQKMQKLYPDLLAEDVYDNLSDERKKLVKPIVTPDEQFVREWLNKPYTPKEIKEGVSIFKTMKGERVRSKSEMIIADRLFISGIPYKYECPIDVMGIIYHPDFTILRISDRKILYLEHNGKMDDPEYKNDMVTRLNDFNQVGIRQGKNLFLTFESSSVSFDVRTLESMIAEHFR